MNETTFVMYFKVNARSKNWTVYTIYETDKIGGKEGYLGYTDYDKHIVVLEKASIRKMIDTLKHELMHVWLKENGYNQDKLFDVEELCDIVAYSNSFISSVTDDYLREKMLT